MTKRFSQEVSDQQIARSKELQLMILDEVIEFCDEHKLTVHIAFGTLLGAVRHKGYIPWDDDIDLAMPRKDYEEFLRLYAQKGNPDFPLRCFPVEYDCPYTFAKVRLRDTSLVMFDTTGQNTDPGISIDVFPIDYASKDAHLQKKRRRKYLIWRMLFISSVMWRAGNLQTGWKRFVYSAIRTFLHILLLPIPRGYIYAKYLQALGYENGVFKQTDLGYFTESDNGAPTFNLGEDFTTTYLEFEGKKYPAPSNWDEILTGEYGDYQQLPPPEKRVGHKPVHIDFGPWQTRNPR